MTAPISLRERASERQAASHELAIRIGRILPASYNGPRGRLPPMPEGAVDYLLATMPDRVVTALMAIETPKAGVVRGEDSPRPSGRIDAIIWAVCEEWDVRRTDLISSRQTRNLVRPRQVVMYLAKRLTSRSLPDIGRRIHRDHTTVLYGARCIEAAILADEDLRERVARVESQFAPVS